MLTFLATLLLMIQNPTPSAFPTGSQGSSPTPEPATIGMLLLAGGAVAYGVRRKLSGDQADGSDAEVQDRDAG